MLRSSTATPTNLVLDCVSSLLCTVATTVSAGAMPPSVMSPLIVTKVPTDALSVVLEVLTALIQLVEQESTALEPNIQTYTADKPQKEVLHATRRLNTPATPCNAKELETRPAHTSRVTVRQTAADSTRMAAPHFAYTMLEDQGWTATALQVTIAASMEPA
jgi:hypothetical protein